MKKLLFTLMVLSLVVLTGCAKEEPFVSPYSEEQRVAFATCLTEKGFTMYGTERCPHCKDQKELFWDAFAQATYVDCDQQKLVCDVQGIDGYPTWKDTQWNAYPGTQQLEALAQASGCEL